MNLLLALLIAMSDSAALAKAKTLWGNAAMIGIRRGTSGITWTRQVGCHRPGAIPDFVVAGSGLGSWEAAFFNVNMATNGPRVLTAVATDTSGLTATAPPVTIYLCNPPVAP